MTNLAATETAILAWRAAHQRYTERPSVETFRAELAAARAMIDAEGSRGAKVEVLLLRYGATLAEDLYQRNRAAAALLAEGR